MAWDEEDELETSYDVPDASAPHQLDFSEISREASRKSETPVELAINFYRELLKRLVITKRPTHLEVTNKELFKEMKVMLQIDKADPDELPFKEGITRKERVEKLVQIVPFDLSVKLEDIFAHRKWIIMSRKEQEKILTEAKNYIDFIKSERQGFEFIAEIFGVRDNSPNEEWNSKVKELKEKSVIKKFDIISDYSGFELKVKIAYGAIVRKIDLREKNDSEIKEFCRNLEKEEEEYRKKRGEQ